MPIVCIIRLVIPSFTILLSSDFLIIYSNFSIGDKLTLQEIKETLKNLYLENNIKSSPKAVDLLNYFEVMKTRAKDKETGKFVAAYKILKIKEK